MTGDVRETSALAEALAACRQSLADHQAGILTDDELRTALFHSGLVVGENEAWLLDLESGRWHRYNGITISEWSAPVRRADLQRWRHAIESLQAGGPS